MTRLAIFAHYDKNNEIEDYVIEYLKGLKEVANDIIFVSDSNISQEELDKISNLTKHIISGRHGEYDFGSYKRGFLWAYENEILKDYKELIFANDSCYAPLYPFQIMFDKMEDTPADFWGATLNDNKKLKTDEIRNHVQSFFLVFKPQVFNNSCFKAFIEKICAQKTKEDVINKYEIGLSIYLQEHGYECDAYSKISKIIKDSQVGRYKEMVIREKLPLLKRNVVLKKEIKSVYPTKIKQLISKTQYNYDIIKKDCDKNEIKVSNLKDYLRIFKQFKRKIIRVSIKNGYVTLFNKVNISW